MVQCRSHNTGFYLVGPDLGAALLPMPQRKVLSIFAWEPGEAVMGRLACIAASRHRASACSGNSCFLSM